MFGSRAHLPTCPLVLFRQLARADRHLPDADQKLSPRWQTKSSPGLSPGHQSSQRHPVPFPANEEASSPPLSFSPYSPPRGPGKPTLRGLARTAGNSLPHNAQGSPTTAVSRSLAFRDGVRPSARRAGWLGAQMKGPGLLFFSTLSIRSSVVRRLKGRLGCAAERCTIRWRQLPWVWIRQLA